MSQFYPTAIHGNPGSVTEIDSGLPRDPVREQLGEASLRILAGVIPASTLAELRQQVLSRSDSFPWKAVNARILRDPVDDAVLLQRCLRAQRDWVVRGGPQRSRRALKARGKSTLAYFVARGIYFALYTVAVVVLLILLRQTWPSADIYRVLEWLRDALPGLFVRH